MWPVTKSFASSSRSATAPSPEVLHQVLHASFNRPADNAGECMEFAPCAWSVDADAVRQPLFVFRPPSVGTFGRAGIRLQPLTSPTLSAILAVGFRTIPAASPRAGRNPPRGSLGSW